MGQKRLTVVDLSQEEEQQKVSQRKMAKTAGKVVKAKAVSGKDKGRLADKSEPIAGVIFEAEKETEVKEEGKEPVVKRKPRIRSRRYKLARSMVDKTIVYPLDQALDLLKKTNVARFEATISAHLNLVQQGINKEVNFPHPTGKQTRVAIASDDLLAKIATKKIDFDILLSTPEMMPKLAKVAKILGPLGLMPNPKNSTITDNPEKRKKELESGVTQVKTEGKAPLMHVVVGKTSYPTQNLVNNVQALVMAVGPGNIKKLTLASTMSPGIKVDLQPFHKPKS